MRFFFNLGHPELMRGGALPCTNHDINCLSQSVFSKLGDKSLMFD